MPHTTNAQTASLPYSMHPRMLGHQLVFAAFLLTQILDGVFTYAGVSMFGIAAEGNPVLRG